MLLRGVLIGGASTALGLGLGLLAAPPALSAPAVTAEAPPAAVANAHVQESDTEITVEAEPSAVVTDDDGATRIRYSASVSTRLPGQSVAGITLEILEPNYRPVYAVDGPLELTTDGSLSGSLETPEGLQDGYYMARVWGAASDGSASYMDGAYEYFEVEDGSASPRSKEDFFENVEFPNYAWSSEERELTDELIKAYQKRQKKLDKEQEKLIEKINAGAADGASGL